MKLYEFVLKFALPGSSNTAEDLLEALYDAGCDDALIGVGEARRIALDFSREAESARDAILGAIRNVRSALPEALLIEASPDLAGLSEIAEVLGFSRQNARKMATSQKNQFPLPAHEGNPTLWHLADVLAWSKSVRLESVDNELLEVAQINRQVNLMRELHQLQPHLREELEALMA